MLCINNAEFLSTLSPRGRIACHYGEKAVSCQGLKLALGGIARLINASTRTVGLSAATDCLTKKLLSNATLFASLSAFLLLACNRLFFAFFHFFSFLRFLARNRSGIRGDLFACFTRG